MNDASRPAFDLRYRGTVISRVYYTALDQLPGVLASLPTIPRRILLCTDDTVWALHGTGLEHVLRAAGLAVSPITIPAGERHKTLATVAGVYERLAELGVERTDVLVALGGGVTGDLFGFVAATYLRGLPLIQVPTTVVAQVDSSIGGKVGVDLPAGKNLVGAFKHPDIVLIDNALLATLPDDEWIAGTAEVVKHGVIADAALFEAIEADPEGWRQRTRSTDELLAAAIAVKARVVQVDEREQGPRMALNYGHTLGHALEMAAGYAGLRHGEAVAWGMSMAARLAEHLALVEHAFVLRQDHLLQALGLLRPLPALDEDAVWSAMFRDKKVRGGRLRWILPQHGPGQVVVRDDVPQDLVRALSLATVRGRLLSANGADGTR